VFVCSEALTNVRKYAEASQVNLDVVVEGGAVLVSVVDDGVGGADPAAGSGLSGLRDRVEAIGGVVTVESPAGRGTRIVARIPLAVPAA
jgi:signal transduction histidine kinase